MSLTPENETREPGGRCPTCGGAARESFCSECGAQCGDPWHARLFALPPGDHTWRLTFRGGPAAMFNLKQVLRGLRDDAARGGPTEVLLSRILAACEDAEELRGR